MYAALMTTVGLAGILENLTNEVNSKPSLSAQEKAGFIQKITYLLDNPNKFEKKSEAEELFQSLLTPVESVPTSRMKLAAAGTIGRIVYSKLAGT